MLKRLFRPNRVGLIAALTLLAVMSVLHNVEAHSKSVNCLSGNPAPGPLLTDPHGHGYRNVEVDGVCEIGPEAEVKGNIKLLFIDSETDISLTVLCGAVIGRNIRTEGPEDGLTDDFSVDLVIYGWSS